MLPFTVDLSDALSACLDELLLRPDSDGSPEYDACIRKRIRVIDEWIENEGEISLEEKLGAKLKLVM